MADAGFFKGTSIDQDSRFANKQKKLLKQMKFPDNIANKVDMSKVNLDILKPWITKRLQELLGVEDDVVIEFVFNQLDDKNPDPMMIQINLTGFLGGSKARLFIGELWKLLGEAQTAPDGIPAELVEMKKRELLIRQEEDDRLREIRRREEDSHRQEVKPDIEKLDNKTNGRNLMFTSSNRSRNENGKTAGYKSRPQYDDRRRSPAKPRQRRNSRTLESKPGRSEKKAAQPVSMSSESEDDHRRHAKKNRGNLQSTSNRQDRRRSPVQSPSHSRSPVVRKKGKHPQRPSSSDSNASYSSQTDDKILRKKIVDLSDNQKTNKRHKTDENEKSSTTNLLKETTVSKNKRKSLTLSPPPPRRKTVPDKTEKTKSKSQPKKDKKTSKRTRSTSANSSSVSRSNSTVSLGSDSESEKDMKQKKKTPVVKSALSSRSRSPSPTRNKKGADRHKSRRHSTHNSKSSSRKQTKHRYHQSNDSKRKPHRDHLDKSTSKKTSRNDDSSKKKNSNAEKEVAKPLTSSPPRKPRLESQIRAPTPPPSKLPKPEEEAIPSMKPARTERIVVLEESRANPKRVSNEDQHKDQNSNSEDETEIDLRERLLREKAIKSMKSRQLNTSTSNNDSHMKTASGRIVYQT